MGPLGIFTATLPRPRSSVLGLGLAALLLATSCSSADHIDSSTANDPRTTDDARTTSGARTTDDATATDTADVGDDNSIERLVPRVIATHPFSAESFTQGLEFAADGSLLVGTGQWGESRIYRAQLTTHEIAEHHELADEFFGEGITHTGEKIWQLTWQAGEAIERDPQSLEEIGRAHYDGEGWGICARDGELLVSDGSATVVKRDPDTFELLDGAELQVTAKGAAVDKINELECVGDSVYANRFLTDEIIRFSAITGEVDAIIDASSLKNNAVADPNHVLNGIAFDQGSGHFFLTGKRWPDLYEVEFVADPAHH